MTEKAAEAIFTHEDEEAVAAPCAGSRGASTTCLLTRRRRAWLRHFVLHETRSDKPSWKCSSRSAARPGCSEGCEVLIQARRCRSPSQKPEPKSPAIRAADGEGSDAYGLVAGRSSRRLEDGPRDERGRSEASMLPWMIRRTTDSCSPGWASWSAVDVALVVRGGRWAWSSCMTNWARLQLDRR